MRVTIKGRLADPTRLRLRNHDKNDCNGENRFVQIPTPD
jgi:hypothetical protein